MKSVSKIYYIVTDTSIGATPAVGPARGLEEDYAMTFQIIHLSTQIQQWLNLQVARHLAAQAEKLEPVKH